MYLFRGLSIFLSALLALAPIQSAFAQSGYTVSHMKDVQQFSSEVLSDSATLLDRNLNPISVDDLTEGAFHDVIYAQFSEYTYWLKVSYLPGEGVLLTALRPDEAGNPSDQQIDDGTSTFIKFDVDEDPRKAALYIENQLNLLIDGISDGYGDKFISPEALDEMEADDFEEDVGAARSDVKPALNMAALRDASLIIFLVGVIGVLVFRSGKGLGVEPVVNQATKLQTAVSTIPRVGSRVSRFFHPRLVAGLIFGAALWLFFIEWGAKGAARDQAQQP